MGGGLGSYRAPLYKRVKDEYVELIIYMHMHYVSLGMVSLIKLFVERRGPKYPQVSRRASLHMC